MNKPDQYCTSYVPYVKVILQLYQFVPNRLPPFFCIIIFSISSKSLAKILKMNQKKR
jgi:hypothetical protein